MTGQDKKEPAGNAGPQVDSEGRPVVDPTANVIALVEAANLRQDDLRALNDRRVEAEFAHVKELGALRAEHAKEMRELETKRLDAIRQVDITAVKTEADRAQSAIQALAMTTRTDAENLRMTVQNSAQALAQQASESNNRIIERLAALERSSYEGAGKQAVQDPAMVELVRAVKTLTESGAMGAGVKTGGTETRTAIYAGLGAIVVLLGILGALGVLSR